MTETYLKFNELIHPLKKGTFLKINKNETQNIIIKEVYTSLSDMKYTYKCEIKNGGYKELTSDSPNYVLNILEPRDDMIMEGNNSIIEEYNEIELFPIEFILKVYNSYFKENIEKYKTIEELKNILYIEKNNSNIILKSYENNFKYNIIIEENKLGKFIGFVSFSTEKLLADKFVCYEYKTVLELLNEFNEFNPLIKFTKIVENDKNKKIIIGDEVYVFNENFSYNKEKMNELIDNMPLSTKMIVLRNYIENKGFVHGYINGIRLNPCAESLEFIIYDSQKNLTFNAFSKCVFTDKEFVENKEEIINNLINLII